jgi:hypothetical protein
LSSPHIFVPLNNATYLYNALNTPSTRFHELDWWDERHLRVALSSSSTDGPAVDAEVRLSCTLSQHNLSRGLFDRFRTLWGSWVVEDLRSHKRAYFAGNTAYRAVRHDGRQWGRTPGRQCSRLPRVLEASKSRYCPLVRITLHASSKCPWGLPVRSRPDPNLVF